MREVETIITMHLSINVRYMYGSKIADATPLSQ